MSFARAICCLRIVRAQSGNGVPSRQVMSPANQATRGSHGQSMSEPRSGMTVWSGSAGP